MAGCCTWLDDIYDDKNDDHDDFNDDCDDFPWQATCCCTWLASEPSLSALPLSPLPGRILIIIMIIIIIIIIFIV